MTKLQVFAKGGLGNQLIQIAYSHNLLSNQQDKIIVNTFYFSRLYAKISGNTPRKFKYTLLPDYIDDTYSHLLGLFYFIKLKILSLVKSRRVVDDNRPLLIINDDSSFGMIFIDGYFQGEAAFNANTNFYWNQVANKVCLNVSNYTSIVNEYQNSIIIHIRHGDYLNAENLRIFYIQDVNHQIKKAIDLNNQLNLKLKINILSDPSTNLWDKISPDVINCVNILPSRSELEDLLVIASHRYIIASNSTFCLCAAKISEYITGNSNHLILPDNWYVDQNHSDSLISSLANCTFANRA